MIADADKDNAFINYATSVCTKDNEFNETHHLILIF